MFLYLTINILYLLYLILLYMSPKLHSTIINGIKDIINQINIDNFQGKHVLITGGAGFLGSWICDVLIEAGSEVTCIDNYSSGLSSNISRLINHPNFHHLKSDIPDFNSLKTKFDYILHFASIASPDAYQKYPTETLKVNSLGTFNILELARKHDSKLLFSSTSEIYGDATVFPTPENYWGYVNPVGIRSPYDESKRFSEALIVAYYREYNLNTNIIRLFNTYGPRLRNDGIYGRALSKFIHQAINNLNLTVYGDGKQTRSFTYVTDTIIGVFKTLLSEKHNGEIFNIGNPNETTILDLAHKILSITKSNSKITFLPLPEDDPKRRNPDISKASKLLNWEPNIDLDTGLKFTIPWLKEQIL